LKIMLSKSKILSRLSSFFKIVINLRIFVLKIKNVWQQLKKKKKKTSIIISEQSMHGGLVKINNCSTRWLNSP